MTGAPGGPLLAISSGHRLNRSLTCRVLWTASESVSSPAKVTRRFRLGSLPETLAEGLSRRWSGAAGEQPFSGQANRAEEILVSTRSATAAGLG